MLEKENKWDIEKYLEVIQKIELSGIDKMINILKKEKGQEEEYPETVSID